MQLFLSPFSFCGLIRSAVTGGKRRAVDNYQFLSSSDVLDWFKRHLNTGSVDVETRLFASQLFTEIPHKCVERHERQKHY